MKLNKHRCGSKIDIPSLYFWMGQIGCLNGVIAVATIDTGKMNSQLHGITAVIFFGFMTITTFMCTSQLKKFEKVDKSLIHSSSLTFKIIVNYLMILLGFACIYVLLTGDKHRI